MTGLDAGNASCSLGQSPTKLKSGSFHQKLACVMPLDSEIVKHGELLKIGRKTGTMRTRFYVLRDQAMFFYNNRN